MSSYQVAKWIAWRKDQNRREEAERRKLKNKGTIRSSKRKR